MNNLERKMVDVLKDLRENHGVIGIKAEFEAEGTRTDEALRLKDVINKAGLNLTLKIGGCEAIRDIYEARTIGVERIVAPMVESAFALKKYLKAIKLSVPEEEQQDIDFCINIETISAVKCLDEMLAMPEISKLDGLVIGRTDMSGSLGLSSDDINTDQIFKLVNEVVIKAKKLPNLDTTVGGGVSAQSIPFFQKLPAKSLDRFETRKVIFKTDEAIKKDAVKGILKAVGFELLWIKNKRDYYSIIANEDANRITALESRYRKSIEASGGKVE
ncbi:MAG: aldolase/citrate lyase family protein [Candidatus Firestonebacteria bacterium]